MAQSFALGRSMDNNEKGYIYVIAPKDVPRGYWVQDSYPSETNHAAIFLQEFVVPQHIPGSSISHAYEVNKGNLKDRSRKIRNENYSLKWASRCAIMRKRGECDPAGWVVEAKPEEPHGVGHDGKMEEDGISPESKGENSDKSDGEPTREGEDPRCRDRNFKGSKADRDRDSRRKKKQGSSWRSQNCKEQ
ncbi:hypothetical protein QQS21_011890 [Conoideocrella luteorostrata]|uniref:Uncharacterized protein n=1 Tax=Conoideocrella luteorostrata TaxID=1105319 RepID=A0AAJ0FSY0_9HYPO|nr:hypothetical protein QQS21_011890 [Conoideocrella luteorostrata]